MSSARCTILTTRSTRPNLATKTSTPAQGEKKEMEFLLFKIQNTKSFLFSCRTGFNNIVPYNATRQGMPGYELPGVLRDPLMTVRSPKEHNFAIFATYWLNPGFTGGPSRQVWQLHLRANWPDGRHCDEVCALPLPLPHRVLLDRGGRPPHHVGQDWQEPKVEFLKSFHLNVYWALWVLWNNVCLGKVATSRTNIAANPSRGHRGVRNAPEKNRKSIIHPSTTLSPFIKDFMKMFWNTEMLMFHGKLCH